MMMELIYGNNALVAVLLVVLAMGLFTTASGKQVLYLLGEAVDTALSMAEGYNEQYRLDGDETEMTVKNSA